MKRLNLQRGVGTLLLLFLLLPGVGRAQESIENYVQVTGYAEREVTPDEFWLSVTITERDSKGRISVEEQQRAMIATLRRIGVDPDEQLRLADNSSAYHKKGALATARYRIKLTSVEQMQRVWQELVALNLSEVSLQEVAYSAIDSLRDTLRREAILDAQHTARALIEPLGQELGPCFQLVDYDNSRTVRSMKMENAVDFAALVEEESVDAGSSVPEFRTMQLTYRVMAKFLLP